MKAFTMQTGNICRLVVRSRWRSIGWVGGFALWFVAAMCLGAEADFQVGFARRDITPDSPTPMWGYGERKNALSVGTLDPLYADAIVIRAGDTKLALVGLDLGRGPTSPMMEQIRGVLRKQAGIEHVVIVGSHTHHGPVIELRDEEGYGKGKYDAAVAYAKSLPEKLSEAILSANDALTPAKMGVATKSIDFNRNRHSKRQPKPTDPMLAVVRFDDAEGNPIATLVNFAAHPTMTEVMNLRFSADYPGFMKRAVESEMGGACLFMQGASGDMSTKSPEGRHGPQEYGEALAGEVVSLASTMATEAPQRPSIIAKVDRFRFGSRIDFANPLIRLGYSQAFFSRTRGQSPRRLQAGRDHRNGDGAFEQGTRFGQRFGRILLQPCEPPQAAIVCREYALLRLLKRAQLLPADN